MHTPPLPGLVALLLETASRIGYRITVSDAGLGLFSDGVKDYHLIVKSGGIDGTWALVDTLPSGFGSMLVSRATYEALHGGQMATDGTLRYAGKNYRLQTWFDGSRWTAKLNLV